MAHSIQIPDALWDLYDGSPSAMRDTLWQAKVTVQQHELEDEPEPGTVIHLRWKTKCSICRRQLLKGQQAVIRTRGEATEIICLEHAQDQMGLDLGRIDEIGSYSQRV